MFSQPQHKKSSSASILTLLADGVNVNLGSFGEFSLRVRNLQSNLSRSLAWLMSCGVAVAYEDDQAQKRGRFSPTLTEVYFKAGETNYGLNVLQNNPCVMDALVPKNCEIMRNVATRAINFETIFSWDDGYFAKLGRGQETYNGNTDDTDDRPDTFYFEREQVEQCLRGIIDECYKLYEEEQSRRAKNEGIIAGTVVGSTVGGVLLLGFLVGLGVWYARKRAISRTIIEATRDEAQPLVMHASETPAAPDVSKVEPENKPKPKKPEEIKPTFQQRLENLRKAGFNEEIPDHFNDLVSHDIINEPRACRDGFTIDKTTVENIIENTKNPNEAKCVIGPELLVPTYPNLFAKKTIDDYLSQKEQEYQLSEEIKKESASPSLSLRRN